RQLVIALRASGQRREEFENLIKRVNDAGGWAAEGGEKIKIRVVGLLRDVDTRWSSLFLMLKRLLEL
ncbi:hypothetical protein K523DRAFT_197967, partial [Schizophyllum commune Tattone D]